MIEEHVETGNNYGITIGTELALDTLFTRGAPNKAKHAVHIYNGIYINLHTLTRNVISQFNAKALEKIHADEIMRVVLKDITLINKLTEDKITVTYYGTSLTGFASSVFLPFLREPKTVKQKKLAYTISTVVTALVKKYRYPRVNGMLHTTHGENLVLTNFLMDLLSNPANELLESHTGKVKGKKLWYTKLHKIPHADMSTLPPLNRMLLFTGTSDIFSPSAHMRFREKLIDIATRKGWNSATSNDRVLFDLRIGDSTLFNNWNQTPDIERVGS